MKYVLSILLLLLMSCGPKTVEVTIQTDPPGAGITIDGTEHMSPAVLKLEENSSYTVLLELKGYKSKNLTFTTMSENLELSETLEAERVKLGFRVNASQPEIKINGMVVKQQPIFIIPGTYTLNVTRKGYKPLIQELIVEPGEDKVEPVTMERVESLATEAEIWLKERNSEKLKKLITPHKKDTPVFDSLQDTEEGDAYYSIGRLMEVYYEEEDWESVIFLLDNGASGFIEGGEAPLVRSLLFKAVRADNPALIERLLKAGAKRDIHNGMGNMTSDLEYAINSKAYKALEYLLKTGSDPNMPIPFKEPGEEGKTTTYAVFTNLSDTTAVELLLKYGASLELEKVSTKPEAKDNKTRIRIEKIVKDGTSYKTEVSETYK